MNQETASFITTHRHDDVHQLALKGCPANVDLPFALEQISGWQTAQKKWPTWAATEGLLYPPHLNMEQSSSEQTARYKASLCRRLDVREKMVDLTGGMGVDFFFMAQAFNHAIYVERQPNLCELATHNMARLGLTHVEIKNADSIEYSQTLEHASLLFLDPARRHQNGKRAYALEDCSPNIVLWHRQLLKKCDYLLLKLSPMFDWHEAVKVLEGVREVHIVSVKNECKELLLLLSGTAFAGESQNLRVVCVNDEEVFEFSPDHSSYPATISMEDEWHLDEFLYLYEPNSSVMKAGCFGEVAQRFGITPLGRDSHLFVAKEDIGTFVGRKFQICAISSPKKSSFKTCCPQLQQANVAVRNFPMSAQALQQKLQLKDGGDTYIFGTTINRRQHVLIICRKCEEK